MSIKQDAIEEIAEVILLVEKGGESQEIAFDKIAKIINDAKQDITLEESEK